MDPLRWAELQEWIRGLNRQELLMVKEMVDRTLSENAEPAQSTVEEYVPYRDGHLQLEYRTNPKTGTRRGPYYYFRYHDGGKQRTLYIGSVDEEEAKRRVDQKRGS
jgi:hypothetical protein